MNHNSRNDEKDKEQNVHGLRKISLCEKYCVKNFPYPGRRRYTPCVYQSEDGGITISNDVFGLTIRQFERIYNTCLDRRKAHKQYILNIRYPEKTSDEYMEYLENSRYCNKEYLSWSENDLKDTFLYEHLVHTVGSEIDIRKRQQLFIIHDMINDTNQSAITSISSGSLAEGINLPGSDRDIMFVITNVDVIRDVINIKHPVQRTTLVMETDNDHPGFSRLRLIAGGDGTNDFITFEYFESTRQGLYMSVNKFVSNINKRMSQKMSLHGPCLSDKSEAFDVAYCLRSKCLPYNTIPWVSRYRQQWPPNYTIEKIKEYGCLLVPIGPRDMSDCNILWRLSFSVAEKQLVHSFNFTQLLCYCLLKITLKSVINTNKHAEGLLCSYFMKTSLFWVSEEVDIDTFQLSKLFICFSLCLDKLKLWVQNCYCPNYFIPEHNMFLGKINSDNNTNLLNVLDGITCDGIDGLTTYCFPIDIGSFCLLRKDSESSFIKLDLLFYRICMMDFPFNLSKCLKALMFTECLIKSKYSTFIIGVCKHHHALLSQYTVQSLPLPSITKEAYNKHKRYHRHLQDGIKTDAVSGWLLYASFYYVTGQFDATLRITDYVLSRCSPGMLILGCVSFIEEHILYYRSHVHSTMSLNEKMQITTLAEVIYTPKSSLLPAELQLDVDNHYMVITPIVLSHCLRFLCFHHLRDIFYRQHALQSLELTVKKKTFIALNNLSTSLTILGVCYEISGDKDAAYQCYDEALQCDGIVCSSAEARKSKLFKM